MRKIAPIAILLFAMPAHADESWNQFTNDLARQSAITEAADDAAFTDMEARNREHYQNEQLQQRLDQQQKEIDYLRSRSN